MILWLCISQGLGASYSGWPVSAVRLDVEDGPGDRSLIAWYVIYDSDSLVFLWFVPLILNEWTCRTQRLHFYLLDSKMYCQCHRIPSNCCVDLQMINASLPWIESKGLRTALLLVMPACFESISLHWKKMHQHLGMSENGVYPQWNSHLVGIMISQTIGCRGTLFSDKPISIGQVAKQSFWQTATGRCSVRMLRKTWQQKEPWRLHMFVFFDSLLISSK